MKVGRLHGESKGGRKGGIGTRRGRTATEADGSWGDILLAFIIIHSFIHLVSCLHAAWRTTGIDFGNRVRVAPLHIALHDPVSIKVEKSEKMTAAEVARRVERRRKMMWQDLRVSPRSSTSEIQECSKRWLHGCMNSRPPPEGAGTRDSSTRTVRISKYSHKRRNGLLFQFNTGGFLHRF